MTKGQPTIARREYESSLSEFAKWNVLRVIGNSTLGKAAIVVPVLGYLLLFNHEVVDFLKLHSTLCNECTISWRLNFFYFGSFFVAIGSILFALACPVVIARHPGAHDFYEAENEYFSAPEHRAFLVGHILKARRTTYIRPEYMYPSTTEKEMLVPATLSQSMGEHYFLQNRSRRWTRLTVFWCYVAGAVLLAVPTIATFFQVLQRLLGL